MPATFKEENELENNTVKMSNFIIKFFYILIWTAIIYTGLKYALPLFMPFVVAFGLAFMLKPLINLITRKTPLPRKPASIILLTLLYLVAGTLLVLAGIKLTVQIGSWFAELPRIYRQHVEPAIGEISTSLDDIINKLDPAVQRYLETASSNISKAVDSLISSISSGAISLVTGTATRVPWMVVGVFLTIIASFFFVVDYEKITEFIAHQLPKNVLHKTHIIKDFVINVLFKFTRAYLILMTITFAEVAVGLLILRVPNAFLIAFFTAIMDILPVLGTGTIMIPWAAYSLFSGNIPLAIGLGVLYAIITVVRQFLEPRIVGSQIGLYPLLTLICMFIGVKLFGFWGMFALPVTLTVIIHLNHAGEISIFKEYTPPATAKDNAGNTEEPPSADSQNPNG